MTAVTLTYCVSAQTEDEIILAFEVKDGEELLRRWEEGWERNAFLPLFKKEQMEVLSP